MMKNSYAPAKHLYALLDGAQIHAWTDAVLFNGLARSQLIANIEYTAIHAGAHLFCWSTWDENIVKALAEQAEKDAPGFVYGLSWGFSNADLSEVSEHLKNYINPEFDFTTEKYVLRLQDARVLTAYMGAAEQNTRLAFLAPFDSWHAMDRRGKPLMWLGAGSDDGTGVIPAKRITRTLAVITETELDQLQDRMVESTLDAHVRDVKLFPWIPCSSFDRYWNVVEEAVKEARTECRIGHGEIFERALEIMRDHSKNHSSGGFQ
jgi:hypothetical protein